MSKPTKKLGNGWSDASYAAHVERMTGRIVSEETKQKIKKAKEKTYADPEYRKRLSVALKAKWASGTRKPIPKEAIKRRAKTLKTRYANGELKSPFLRYTEAERKEICSRGGKTVSEKKLQVNQRIGKSRRGKTNTGKNKKGSNNAQAQWWAFRSPLGQLVIGKGLPALIEQNKSLFDPATIHRAVNGLSLLYGNGMIRSISWKGWTAAPEELEKIGISPNHKRFESISKALTGKPATGRTAKGVNNVHAKVHTLRSPMNVVYHFKNINQFVRDNLDLFLPEDVIWKGRPLACRAATGLQSISRAKATVGSWKGWTVVSDTERDINWGLDTLRRDQATVVIDGRIIT